MKAGLRMLAGAAAVAAGISAPAIAANGDQATSLFQFDGASGYDPQGGVVTDANGTIYGTTTIGGTGSCSGGAGCGTVYALSPPPQGSTQWAFNVLYNFQNGKDGSFAQSQLTVDPASGIVYGYTSGGTPGTVFALLPPGNPGGPWTFQLLYAFTGKADGNLEDVYSPLILSGGSLYGIASGGAKSCGQFGCGSVFELTPPQSGNGSWTEATLFNFKGTKTSGLPTWIAGFDDGGSLYVSTALGKGAVVQLSPSDGTWNETVITKFKGGNSGSSPSSLVLTPNGTLYGLANKTRAGFAFALTQGPDSGWTRTKIAEISDHKYGPVSLAAGPNGTLIGAIAGDVDFFAGSVFQLTPPQNGNDWTYVGLWNFNRGPDRNPNNVVTGLDGNLFGVLNGGDSDNGSLFELQ
jgi:hypothetical protein